MLHNLQKLNEIEVQTPVQNKTMNHVNQPKGDCMTFFLKLRLLFYTHQTNSKIF